MEKLNGDLCAARLAIFVLDAIAPPDQGSFAGSEIMVKSEGALLDVGSAAGWLAALPKPVECSAEIVETVLAVSAQPLTPEHQWLHSSNRSGDARRYGNGGLGDALDEILVRCVKKGFSRVVRRECLDAFERDYVLITKHTRTMRAPTAEDRSRGVAEIVTYDWSSMRFLAI